MVMKITGQPPSGVRRFRLANLGGQAQRPQDLTTTQGQYQDTNTYHSLHNSDSNLLHRTHQIKFMLNERMSSSLFSFVGNHDPGCFTDIL